MKELSIEEKDLLLVDLCVRLPYGVKGLAYIVGEPCNINANVIGIINESIVTNYESPMLELINLSSKDIIIKPYFRPMSSMTEEEMVEFKWLNGECDKMPTFDYIPVEHYRLFDWLNRNHFDYRGLIEKGLALEAPENMYNLKNK